MCFYYFHFFLWWSIKFRNRIQKTNQKQQFIVQASVLFKRKYYTEILHAYYTGLTSLVKAKCKITVTCKQHVRQLSLRSFCILLLNWDIRLQSLRSFNLSHRKIRSTITTLFQLSTARLTYHVHYAVVIQVTEKYIWLHSLSCFISQLRYHTTITTLR